MGPLKQSLVENISLQRCHCNIFGLTVTMVLFAKEAGFYRFWVFFQASSLQKEVGDPHFFHISDITNSSSFNGKISRKKSMLEKFGANVLKWARVTSLHTLLMLTELKMLVARRSRQSKSGLGCKTSNAKDFISSILATFQRYSEKSNNQG